MAEVRLLHEWTEDRSGVKWFFRVSKGRVVYVEYHREGYPWRAAEVRNGGDMPDEYLSAATYGTEIARLALSVAKLTEQSTALAHGMAQWQQLEADAQAEVAKLQRERDEHSI